MTQSKHDRDRAEIEKARKHFRKWTTEKLREHLLISGTGLYKHARLAIQQVLAERGEFRKAETPERDK